MSPDWTSSIIGSKTFFNRFAIIEAVFSNEIGRQLSINSGSLLGLGINVINLGSVKEVENLFQHFLILLQVERELDLE